MRLSCHLRGMGFVTSPPTAAMRKLGRVLSVVPLMLVSVLAASEEMIWRGYYVTAAGPSFILSVEGKSSSSWLKLGQTYEGYALVGFDQKKEILTVERAGTAKHLSLAKAVIASSRPEAVTVRKNEIVIEIAGHAPMRVANSLNSLRQLRESLRAIAARAPESTVAIKAPANLPVDFVRSVFNACSDAGLSQISFDTH